MLLAGCGSAPLTDASQIVRQSQTAMGGVAAAHFRLDATGQLVIGVDESSPAPSAASSGAPVASGSRPASTSSPAAPTSSPAAASSSPAATSSGAPSGPVSLAGSWAEGDVSLAQSTARLTFSAPGFGASAEVIVVGDQAYVRTAGASDWRVEPASDLPVDPATDPAQALPAIMTLVADPRLKPTLVGLESCGGGSCYHLSETVLKDVAGQAIGSGGAALGDGHLDLWIERDGFRVYRLDFSSSSATAGTFTIRLVLTRYDESLAIVPPQPDLGP